MSFTEKAPGPQTFPVVETDDGPKVLAFGHYWDLTDDISIHLSAFRLGLMKKDGGMGKTRHLLEAHNLIWPKRMPTLHQWTVDRYKTFNEGHTVVTLAGGAGSGKSADCAYFALLWWWALPQDRTVLVCSTTLQSLLKRIWSYIQEGLYSAQGQLPGIVRTNPTPQILYDKRDTKHGIFGIPLKEGQSDRTLRELIGIHPNQGLLVIVDEASDVTTAVLDAITNWTKGEVEFQMIAVANSKSRTDLHGKLSTPVGGWSAVDPDIHERWETKYGVCLYFDCYKSPAIHAPHKDRLTFLINEKEIKKEEARLGKNDPKFWRFVRGFWPPDDLLKTVLTITDVQKYLADKAARWAGRSNLIMLAALDPAFTSEGDECILRFATMGTFENGIVGLDFGGEENILSLKLDTTSQEPISYQIVRLSKRECLARDILPEHFGADTWGFGIGAGDLLETTWSPNIHRIMSAGAPSDRFVDSDAGETAKEVYDRRITELWFSMRTFVQSGQIRGLDEWTIEELCSREYVWKGRKLSLEKKTDYKKRMGREDSSTGSPDRADAAVLLLEVARQNGLEPHAKFLTADDGLDWEKRWELQLQMAKFQTEEREDMWSEDPILNSVSFQDSAWSLDDED